MTVQSMTGFARHIVNYTPQAGASGAAARINWEIRSVNGKGLDIRFRIPHGFDDLEQQLRASLGRVFSRGSFQVSLTIDETENRADFIINEALLHQVLQTAKQLETQYGLRPPSLDGLLNLRGILEQPQALPDDEAGNALKTVLLASFEEVLGNLQAMRRQEGKHLANLLGTHVDKIAELAQQARNDASRSAEAIRQRLAGQVALLLEAVNGNGSSGVVLDEQRLHMEAAFLATRADIQEELDRLDMHVAAARKLLAEGGVIGRKLDFLSQEFNRETNTLCSKSNAASITAIGLELKSVVDQFREQVQNLE
ncbi:YicC/YloC family endoribonuclease [Pseudochrobactrum sp. HB0163]|uniref:YicC/YloC family endoribonuclease n=1 Tax=Pseudochrobactrum sp. HB0163 TaxID=3450708 RepID=UPI003F6DC358